MDIEGQRSKEDQPSVGFPDICFAIEDFDVAFKGLVSAGHLAFRKAPCCSPLDAMSHIPISVLQLPQHPAHDFTFQVYQLCQSEAIVLAPDMVLAPPPLQIAATALQ